MSRNRNINNSRNLKTETTKLRRNKILNLGAKETQDVNERPISNLEIKSSLSLRDREDPGSNMTFCIRYGTGFYLRLFIENRLREEIIC